MSRCWAADGGAPGRDQPHRGDSAAAPGVASDRLGPPGRGQHPGVVLERHLAGVAEGEALAEGQLARLGRVGSATLCLFRARWGRGRRSG